MNYTVRDLGKVARKLGSVMGGSTLLIKKRENGHEQIQNRAIR